MNKKSKIIALVTIVSLVGVGGFGLLLGNQQTQTRVISENHFTSGKIKDFVQYQNADGRIRNLIVVEIEGKTYQQIYDCSFFSSVGRITDYIANGKAEFINWHEITNIQYSFDLDRIFYVPSDCHLISEIT